MGNERSRVRRREEESQAQQRRRQSYENDLQRLVEVMLLRRELRRRQRALQVQIEARREEVETRDTRLAALAAAETMRAAHIMTRDRPPEDDVRGLLRGIIRNPVWLDYFAGNLDIDEGDDDDDDDSDDEDDDGSVHSEATTYEGVPELFEEDAQQRQRLLSAEDFLCDEERLLYQAKRIERFKLAVLDQFNDQKELVEKKISQALDLHLTLRDLLRSQTEASETDDHDRLKFVTAIVDDIRQGDDFVQQEEIDKMQVGLKAIQEHLSVLDDLTQVRDDDAITCPVCLSCPKGIVWDCVKCDNVVCEACRPRLTACPTCRVRFRSKPPRRNRWAEKLARMQREKTALTD